MGGAWSWVMRKCHVWERGGGDEAKRAMWNWASSPLGIACMGTTGFPHFDVT